MNGFQFTALDARSYAADVPKGSKEKRMVNETELNDIFFDIMDNAPNLSRRELYLMIAAVAIAMDRSRGSVHCGHIIQWLDQNYIGRCGNDY